MSDNKPVSVFRALEDGIEMMRSKLFSMGFGGWLILGVIAFLENPAGSGGLGTGDYFPFPGRKMPDPASGRSPVEIFETVMKWLQAEWVLFATILIVGAFISLLLLWLRSRAVFIYIDNVARGHSEVVRPWKAHGAAADSFFGLILVVSGVCLIGFVTIVAVAVFGGAFAVQSASRETWGALLVALLPLAFILGLMSLVVVLFQVLLRDFVAPLQMSRGVSAWKACGVLVSLMAAHPLTFLVYILVKIVLTVLLLAASVLVGCLTCCVGFLPIIHHTLFQPVYYAERAWSLRLLAQLDPRDDLTPALTSEPVAG